MSADDGSTPPVEGTGGGDTGGSDATPVDRAGGSGGRAVDVRFSVPGMNCASCAGTVDDALTGVEGIGDVETMPATGTAVVSYDEGSVGPDELRAAIEGAGYEVTGVSGSGAGVEDGDTTGRSAAAERREVWTSSRAIATWVAGLVAAAGLGIEFLFPGSNAVVISGLGRAFHVADLLFLVAVGVGGAEIVRDGVHSARARSLDMDFLMTVAIAGALVASLAFGESLYFEAATLAVLFSVAELLEEYSMDRARQSLRELMDRSPDEARVRRDGDVLTVPAGTVSRGEVVVVRPGEKIPRDGVVVDGESAVDQAPITGESVPVDKAAGDEVYAGTINRQGYLEVEVTSQSGADTLSRIVELVEDAQANRTEREQFVDRFADYYTPVVVAGAVAVTLVPPLLWGAPWPRHVVYGLTLLVLACPCAFVISTPVSVVSGLTSAAKHGVLVKGGRHLEAFGGVDVVAFDKTGTLTEGELTVTDVVPLNGNTEAEVLRCARGLETRSEHPIGEAIVTHADSRTEGRPSVDSFEALTGEGVRADLDGTRHYAGTPGLFEELGFDLSHVHATDDGGVVSRTAREICERHNCLDLLEDTVPKLQSEGKTVVLVGTEAELEGLIAVADSVRPEAAATVERLRELGVDRTVMLTGDNERAAGAIAGEVGVDEFRAELLPEGKVEAIDDLVDEHGSVAMVGDGINDAPALATATVGIAMGAAGTDTALETADIALMGDDLSKLPYAYELAGDANGVIRQNVWTSLAVKAGLALAVPFGYVPIWLAVLAGDAGMTVGVTANAMRLSRLAPSSLTG